MNLSKVAEAADILAKACRATAGWTPLVSPQPTADQFAKHAPEYGEYERQDRLLERIERLKREANDLRFELACALNQRDAAREVVREMLNKMDTYGVLFSPNETAKESWRTRAGLDEKAVEPQPGHATGCVEGRCVEACRAVKPIGGGA